MLQKKSIGEHNLTIKDYVRCSMHSNILMAQKIFNYRKVELL